VRGVLEKEKNKLLLFLPFPFYVLILVDLLVGGAPSSGENAWLRFFANVIFLNAIHVTFTFLMIWKLPELKDWAKERFRFPVLKAVFAGWIAFAVFLAASGAGLPVKGEWRQGLAIAFALLTITWPLFHALWQTMGLSLAHHSGAVASDGRGWERWERTGFFLLFVLTVARLVLNHGLPVPFLAEDGGGWWQVHLWSHSSMVSRILFAASLGAVAMVAYGAWKAPLAQDRKLAKACFLLRVPLYLFIPETSWGFFAVNSVHGLEYLLVFLGMSEASRIEKTERRKMYAVAGAGAVLLASALPLVYFADPFISGTSSSLHILAGATLAISYVHFIMDRHLFRFRDPVTRRFAGPLLVRS
jgi:hypothetical protein